MLFGAELASVGQRTPANGVRARDVIHLAARRIEAVLRYLLRSPDAFRFHLPPTLANKEPLSCHDGACRRAPCWPSAFLLGGRKWGGGRKGSSAGPAGDSETGLTPTAPVSAARQKGSGHAGGVTARGVRA